MDAYFKFKVKPVSRSNKRCSLCGAGASYEARNVYVCDIHKTDLSANFEKQSKKDKCSFCGKAAIFEAKKAYLCRTHKYSLDLYQHYPETSLKIQIKGYRAQGITLKEIAHRLHIKLRKVKRLLYETNRRGDVQYKDGLPYLKWRRRRYEEIRKPTYGSADYPEGRPYSPRKRR